MLSGNSAPLDAFRVRPRLAVQVGNVQIGGGAPPVIQSMTNTDTADIEASVLQVAQLYEAGSRLVRLTVNTHEAAAAIPFIRDRLAAQNIHVPLVGDFHYNGHTLLTAHPACAEALAKYRINPGNVGYGRKRDTQFATLIEIAMRNNKPIRIGVNWGSLDQDLLARLLDENAKKAQPLPLGEITQQALIQSALDSAAYAVSLGLPEDKIILSCKVSDVQSLVQVYQTLAQRCNYPLHLGLTEAGMGEKGIVATTAALSVLLQQGIGDTIRASLTPRPGEDRSTEVRVCQLILQSLGLGHFSPSITACPGCGRTTSSTFQTLAQSIEAYTQAQMPVWRLRYPGVETLKVAVMGCVVNGPGESKHAHIGISLPGTGEAPVAPVFVDGQKIATLRGDSIFEDFKIILENYVAQHFGQSDL